MSFVNLLQTAAASATAPTGQMGSLVFTIVAMILIFYFFLIRPQKKQEKETKKMLDALKKGDKIVTIGGIYGTIFNVTESTVVIKVDDNTKIEFSKTAVSRVIADEDKKVAEKK